MANPLRSFLGWVLQNQYSGAQHPMGWEPGMDDSGWQQQRARVLAAPSYEDAWSANFGGDTRTQLASEILFSLGLPNPAKNIDMLPTAGAALSRNLAPVIEDVPQSALSQAYDAVVNHPLFQKITDLASGPTARAIGYLGQDYGPYAAYLSQHLSDIANDTPPAPSPAVPPTSTGLSSRY